MKFIAEHIEINCIERDVYNRVLLLDDRHIVELGCGYAQKTRDIATSGANRKITAFEVDTAAHEHNLQLADLPNVKFALAGAQAIPLADESADIVIMFKSLHHVPVELMEPSIGEIWRVLKPGGLAYISEPVSAGEFNELLNLFNDDRAERKAAFEAIKSAVDAGRFTLVEQVFFNTPRRYENFADFENRIINSSHSHHSLDEALLQRVRSRFEEFAGEEGATFWSPVRVDLIRKQ
jgi:SAM-dependent methyltransferase